MDRESVNVIEPFGRVFFFSSFFSSSQYTHTHFEDGTALLMNTRANKNNTKKTFDSNEIDSHAFVYLSVIDMLMFHLSERSKKRNSHYIGKCRCRKKDEE